MLGQEPLKNIEPRVRNVVLLVLVINFAILALALAIGRAIGLPFLVFAALAIVFGLLGVVLTVLTVRLRETKTQKALFILTGVSAAGIPICAILHNLVYGLFISFFGKRFWGPGGDEPVFFVLAIFVCPALFLIGAVASGIILIKARITGNKTESRQGASPNVEKPRRLAKAAPVSLVVKISYTSNDHVDMKVLKNHRCEKIIATSQIL